MSGFNIDAFLAHRFAGHAGLLGITYHAKGDGWVELALPYADTLIGDPDSKVLASGPIIALMDMATSVAVWVKRDKFAAQATLDLRRLSAPGDARPHRDRPGRMPEGHPVDRLRSRHRL